MSDRRRAAKARKSRWKAQQKAEEQTVKTVQAAFANARKDVRNMSRADRGAVGRARLTRAHLAEMATQHVAGHFDNTARTVGLSYDATARQLLAEAGGPARIPQWNPVRMVRNAASRWADVRRGTKAIRAGDAMARNEVDCMDPAVLQTIGDNRMTAARLQELTEKGLQQVIKDGPSTLDPKFQRQAYEQLGAQQPGAQQPGAQQDVPLGEQQTGEFRIPQEGVILRDRIQQLEVQVEYLTNEIARLKQENERLAGVASRQAQELQKQPAWAAYAAQVGMEGQSHEDTMGQETRSPQAEAGLPDEYDTSDGSLEDASGGYTGRHQSPEADGPQAQQPGSEPPQPADTGGSAEAWVNVAAGEPQRPAVHENLVDEAPVNTKGQLWEQQLDGDHANVAYLVGAGVPSAQPSTPADARQTLNKSGSSEQHWRGPGAGKSGPQEKQ